MPYLGDMAVLDLLSFFKVVKNFYIIILFLSVFCSSSFLLAGPQKGVMLEFREQEEIIRSKKQSEDYRRKTLNRNILNAVRSVINRSFYYEKEAYYKDLDIKNVAYENPTSSLVYFIKFKNFMARLEYELDPSLNIQNPEHIKFILIEEGPKAPESTEKL